MAKLFHRQKARIVAKADSPLISIFIISYNNVHFLYHAVKSVLSQTYGNCELVISDDASVGYSIEDSARLVCLAAADLIFEESCTGVKGIDRSWKKRKTAKAEDVESFRQELSAWEAETYGNYQAEAISIVQNCFPNIHKIEFKRNTKNLGTVKHLKSLKREANGKYIMFLAADDKLHDPYVVSDVVEYFESLPEDAYILTSQCGMYDAGLDQLKYYAVNEELKQLIMQSSPKELFAELTDWCIVPAAGTFYKKKVFEIFGDLDERYHLIEDWTYFLRLTRNNGKIYFYDRLTYMHRDGGISHGNNAAGNLAYRYYLEDSILLTKQEIIPYLNQIPAKQRKRSKKRYRNTCREYERNFQFAEKNFAQKIWFVLKYADHYIPKFLFGTLSFLEYRAKWGLAAGSCALLLSFLLSLSSVANANSRMLYYLFGICGIALFFGSIIVVSVDKILRILKRGYHFIKVGW